MLIYTTTILLYSAHCIGIYNGTYIHNTVSHSKKIIVKIVKMSINTTYSLLPFSITFNDTIIIFIVVNVSIIS